MLVTSRLRWWQLVLKYRGSELPRTKYRILWVSITAVVVTVLEEMHNWHPNLTPLPFTLIGVALGIFLGFRNNASYDRFWEGRKLWGAAVNVTRTCARQILTLVGPRGDVTPSEVEAIAAVRRELVYRLIAWSHVFRLALRDEPGLSEVEPFLSAEEIRRLEGEHNRPYAITMGTAELLRKCWDRGWIHDMHFPLLDASLTAMTDIQGGCERIKATPLPFSYTTLIHRITALYCYALPFGVVDQVGVFTPFVCAIVALAFFGLDVVGDEIEMPFGFDPNDLPLRTITRMIEVNLRQRLGQSELPPLLQPVDGILD